VLPTPRSASPHRLSLRHLEAIAEGIAASPLWHDLADPTPEARSAVRVVRTDAYEAWVLGWLPGHGVELHDHGDAAAAFTVVEGRLVEITPRDDGSLARLELGLGASRVVPAGHRHDVLNVATERATSIHVYAPHLTSMTFYDAVDGRPVRTEPVDATDGAVWPDAAAHRWLHPAGLSG
jgi:mannose-6-phosphate isomerase-like protein (cupin superfamily)